MYKYFTLTKILYWALGIGGMAAIVILFYLLRSDACIRNFSLSALGEFAAFAAGMAAWVYGSDYAIEALAKRKMKKVLNILYAECDPERFLSWMDKMLKVDNREVYNTYMILNRARGLLEAGRIQEANNAVLGIFTFTKGRKGRTNNAYYLDLLAATQLGLQAYEEAEKSLALFKQMLDTSKLDAERRSQLELEYELEHIALDQRKGIHEGAGEKLNALFSKAENTWSRAWTKYYLGEAYAHAGRTEEAREAFQYAADHGNKLHIAEKAKEELRRMG